MVNNEKVYYKSRDTFNRLNGDPASKLMAAQLFYYLNRTGYNGLCRFNKKGGYNVPFGRYKTINYQDDFSHYQTVLSQWQFSNVDFEQLKVADDDFIYADPPYDTPFHQYSQQGFDWDDQERLAEWLSRHPGPVILSNQATDRVLKLYRKLGFRLRYEIKREFAPYVGVSWNRKLGETADFVRDEGGDPGTFGLVGGLRMWF